MFLCTTLVGRVVLVHASLGNKSPADAKALDDAPLEAVQPAALADSPQCHQHSLTLHRPHLVVSAV